MVPLAYLNIAPWRLAKALYLIDISWALAYGSFPNLGHLAYGSWPVGYLGDMIELTKASYFQELKTIFVIGFSQIWVVSYVLMMLLLGFKVDLEVFNSGFLLIRCYGFVWLLRSDEFGWLFFWIWVVSWIYINFQIDINLGKSKCSS